ncbi:TonB-dependent receptor [Altererythrobacter sp. BO-6]|uniref:TonB-dependent receptor domain-containing protein n=1 Tax=Altererythrobacter sp. BO-6 TaxID=2604537 RepID=UPI0013E1C005|nr:TonB-dependent receptor [Altererythrobacter sp. BO-6]QIG53442.1 TonB-dependent receptor [Altererythrobacter sp. BO-6]
MPPTTIGQIELSGGLRVDKTRTSRANLDTALDGENDETVVLGRASIAWQSPDETTLLYATFSQGFEPADFSLSNLTGADTLLGYGKETADQIEVGYKGRLLDNSLFLTVAAFHIDYNDRQFELQAADPETGGFVEGVVNVGNSTQMGVEFDLTWQLTDNLTLSGGAGYIDAEWDDGTISPVTGLDLSGVQPPNVARWSGSVALEYEGDIGANEFFVRAQGRYKGKSSTNSQFFDAPGDEYPVFENPSYLVVDLAAGVDFGRLSLGARVENLFDERYFNDLQEFPNFAGGLNPGEPGQIIIGTLGQARRIIASVGFDF